ncbi:putative cation-transporting P-type ATPase domain protein [Mycobacterium xenopi 4042]|uniref:Putative cation-transporting P-type ATPase domain protein n=1 Tax=Mycobacterium xenopi 4042 TaxID=1299334 RepID=X8AAK7_MYCXE|nr:putative cation-transporting P-type ATPase domain protein [Mycobacterium xenopi 4042]
MHQLFGCDIPDVVDPGFLGGEVDRCRYPGSLFSFFSIRAAQDAHVIPPMSNSTWRLGFFG